MVQIRILKKSDNKNSFSCGNVDIDYYFKKYAGQNQFKHFIGTNYIATDDKNIFAFITVSSSNLVSQDLPKEFKAKLPQYPLPVLRISRLGVDINYQKQGLAKQIMFLALKLALEQQEKFGCVGIVVDAKNDAVNFYKNLGFVELEMNAKLSKNRFNTIPMFLSIKTIQNAIN